MGLNLTAFMDICLLCCVSSGPPDGFVTVSQESYRIYLSNCVWSKYLEKCCGLCMIWVVAWQRKIVMLMWRDNIKYVLEEQVVMMVGWVKTALEMGWHFW